jgi:hypothetical protein
MERDSQPDSAAMTAAGGLTSWSTVSGVGCGLLVLVIVLTLSVTVTLPRIDNVMVTTEATATVGPVAPGLATTLARVLDTPWHRRILANEHAARALAALHDRLDRAASVTMVPPGTLSRLTNVYEYIVQQQRKVPMCTFDDGRPTGGDIDSKCDLGDLSATTTLALIGDSHALVWFKLFGALGRAHRVKVRLFAWRLCAPMLDLVHWESQSCGRFRAWVRVYLKKLRPRYVVLVWSYPPPPTRTQWEVAAQEYFGLLQSLGSKVLILVDSPNRPAPVPDTLVAHPTSVHTTCSQSRMALLSRELAPLSWRTLIHDSAHKFGCLVLDLLDLVCGKTMCPCITTKELMYWDHAHLTYEYLDTLFPTMYTILKALDFFAIGSK